MRAVYLQDEGDVSNAALKSVWQQRKNGMICCQYCARPNFRQVECAKRSVRQPGRFGAQGRV